jgi:hypothetical protein
MWQGVRLRRRSMIPLGAAVAVMTFMCPAVRGQQVHPRVRVLPYRASIPIPGRMLPDDEFVIIQRPWDVAVSEGDASATASIRYALKVSDTAVIADVTTVTGELTESNSWILTRLTAIVTDVMVSRQSTVSQGERIVVTYDGGGAMIVGNVHVSTAAILDSADYAERSKLELEKHIGQLSHPLNVETGRRYLMFLKAIQSTSTFEPSVMPLAVEGHTIVPAGLRPTDEVQLLDVLRGLYGLKLSEIATKVRRLRKSRPNTRNE